jgi:hypothetical protein
MIAENGDAERRWPDAAYALRVAPGPGDDDDDDDEDGGSGNIDPDDDEGYVDDEDDDDDDEEPLWAAVRGGALAAVGPATNASMRCGAAFCAIV